MIHKLKQHSELDQTDVEGLLRLPLQLATKPRGTFLVREGDEASCCIVLLSGFAHRSKNTQNGARQILSIHIQGDLIDLQNSLLDVADHSVQAMSRVEVAYIPYGAVLDLAAARPGVARALWRDTMVDGSIFREWILNVGHRNARQRIAHLLCEIVARQEAAGLSTGPTYQWPMTQEEIGDATGLTFVHVNRMLQSLKRDGLFTTEPPDVTIVDWPKLREAGEFSDSYLHQDTKRAT